MERDTSELWDYIIIGSGFGGSVSALRLVEKGYRVLMLEKGKRFTPQDFPVTNWDLKRWLWAPWVGFRGLFKMTFFRHITVLSGVGVGGGSLVYGNTLPVPNRRFFQAPTWGKLADWEEELAPHYTTVKQMLGATPNALPAAADQVMQQVAEDVGRVAHYGPTDVAVFFGKPGVTVQDPYFGGKGPARTGCTACGGCMLGCRVGAKNTLDKNYLFLAERLGLEINPDTEVTWVRPSEDSGYQVAARHGRRLFGRKTLHFRTKNVVFAGGVLGTVPLLLALREAKDGLPNLSQRLGTMVRTNSESLIGVVSPDTQNDLSRGVAIGSILHTDEHSSIEPVRYPAGAGFFRVMALPHVRGQTLGTRLVGLVSALLRHPWKVLKAMVVDDWASRTMILLYMRSLEGHLDMRLGRGLTTAFMRGPITMLGSGAPPTASIDEASDLADRVAQRLPGVPMSLLPETLFNIPTTAHVLGGCTMGVTATDGVIDVQHRVFNYPGLYVVDGSAMSANPGVNPSLTIAALAERAMTFIPEKSALRRGR